MPVAVPRNVSVTAMRLLTTIAISDVSAVKVEIAAATRSSPLCQIALKGRPQHPGDQVARRPATSFLAHVRRRRLL